MPIAAALREYLAAQQLRQSPGVELCFGRADERPFRPDSSIAMTYDRYGHLMPGSEAEAAGLLDAYLREQTG